MSERLSLSMLFKSWILKWCQVQILRLCERVFVCGWRGRDHFTPKMWQLHKSIPSGWTWGTRGGRGYHGDGRIQETRDDIKECINRDRAREKREREVIPRGQKEVKQVNHFELLYEWVHDLCVSGTVCVCIVCAWDPVFFGACLRTQCVRCNITSDRFWAVRST